MPRDTVFRSHLTCFTAISPARSLEHVGRGVFDCETALALRLLRKIGRISWTEYSLYTSVAERAGNLFAYHVHWDSCYGQD